MPDSIVAALNSRKTCSSESNRAGFRLSCVRFSQNPELFAGKSLTTCRSAPDSKQRSNLTYKTYDRRPENLKIAHNFNLLHFFYANT
jgi:hypothetical protein